MNQVEPNQVVILQSSRLFEQWLAAHLPEDGITVFDFLHLVFYHEMHGYYASHKNERIGKQGDFITAPEISPLFGQCIAIHLMNFLLERKTPGPFTLVEFGPGKGTLLKDILCLFQKIPAIFQDLKAVICVEACKEHREHQQDVLASIVPAEQLVQLASVADLEHYPVEGTVCLIANEYFDALPIRQYIVDPKTNCQTQRTVRWNKDARGLEFFPAHPVEKQRIIEESPLMQRDVQVIKKMFTHNPLPCLGLFIDYGVWSSEAIAKEGSLQAVYQHQKTDLLDHIGEADITHLVDFSQFEELKTSSIKVELTTQRDFLLSQGIEALLQKAMASAPQNKLAHMQAVSRLIGKGMMGESFKVAIVESKAFL